MKRLVLLGVVLLGLAGGAYYYTVGAGYWGDLHDGGVVASGPRPESVNLRHDTSQVTGAALIGKTDPKQILFGDLHVHSTFSPDAFAGSLPMVQGEGAHPVSDACDFARYCSALDFWSITDHGIGMTPRKWSETKRVVRECNARAGSDANPDMVTYLGWEWTQIGTTPENHYGHKNVILRDTAEDKVPTRPIAAKPIKGSLPYGAEFGIPFWQRVSLAALAPHGNRAAYYTAASFAAELANRPLCEEGKSVHDLPNDCLETAIDPASLYEKLDEWGFPTLVIPHGTTWGFYTPGGVTLDKQLTAQHDNADYNRMIEVFSGHGNSEVYRDWRATVRDDSGKWVCPEPSEGYLPSCWRAGELINERCLAAGDSASECAARASHARQAYVDAGVSGFRVVQGGGPEQWLDSGQCSDCWLPSMNYRPGNSAQYGLAITNFDDPDNPRRFHWGFMASSDNHQARAGTGYKEFGRRGMTESMSLSGIRTPFLPQPEPSAEVVPFDPATDTLQNFDLTETERQSSFFFTGGLIAVHAEGRDRGAIWDALKSRAVYGTSGERILLWFDLVNAGADGTGQQPMGAAVALDRNPVFEVRALGSFEQNPGCPDYAADALGADEVARICLNECHNPSDMRKRIERIEIIRVRPQIREGEDVAGLIDDPWKSISCDPAVPTDQGCQARFEDPDYAASGRPATYYARVIQAAQPTVNGDPLMCERDETGQCIKVEICSGNFLERDVTDDCLAPAVEKAWSSPIYVEPSANKVLARQ